MSHSVRRVFASFVVGAILSSPVAGGSAAAAASQKPPLSVLGSTSTLAVAGSQGQDTATGYFSLLNPGRRSVHISVRFQAASSDKVGIENVTPATVGPGQAQRVAITFSGLQTLDAAANGQLVVTGGASPVAQAVAINPAPQPSAPWPEVVIGGSFFLALMLALAVVGAMPDHDRGPLRNLAPPAPKWNYTSWATTLTAVGAVFGTVLTQATFPPFPKEVAKPTLINLNILFGILVILGPFLFQALRKRTVSPADQEAGRTSTNLTLLIACSFTLWAVLGEIAAFALLTWELVGGGAVGWVVVIVLAAIAVLAARYFLVTTSELVIKRWATPVAPPAAGAMPRMELDVSDVERLSLLTAAPVATVTRNREERSAELTLPAPVERAPSYWSLL
jgi:hypothetical protein